MVITSCVQGVDGWTFYEANELNAYIQIKSHFLSIVLTANVGSTLVMCTLLYTSLCDCNQPTTVTSSSHVHGPLGLTAAVSAFADQQFGTNFPMICEAQTLGKSFNVGLWAGYLSVCMAGRTSDRH